MAFGEPKPVCPYCRGRGTYDPVVILPAPPIVPTSPPVSFDDSDTDDEVVGTLVPYEGEIEAW